MTEPFTLRPAAPKPGPPPTPAAPPSDGVDPAQIGRDVGEYVAQVDELRRTAQDHDRHDVDADSRTGVDLAVLDAQAELLEQAHDVLTATLEQLDRV